MTPLNRIHLYLLSQQVLFTKELFVIPVARILLEFDTNVCKYSSNYQFITLWNGLQSFMEKKLVQTVGTAPQTLLLFVFSESNNNERTQDFPLLMYKSQVMFLYWWNHLT